MMRWTSACTLARVKMPRGRTVHLVLQLVFLERRVPLEDHLVDDRVLDDLDDQVAALQVDLHVGEQVGAEQGLQRQVEALAGSTVSPGWMGR